jgi:serine/threonine-protein kinase HipA
MLWEWNEGMKRMTDRLAVPIPDFCLAAEQAGLPAPKAPQRFASKRFGESELLAPRRRKQPPLPS